MLFSFFPLLFHIGWGLCIPDMNVGDDGYKTYRCIAIIELPYENIDQSVVDFVKNTIKVHWLNYDDFLSL